MFNNNRNKKNGFTLIELVVSMAIFTIILVIAVGSFSRFTQINRREIGEQELQEDMRLSLEILNREIRTGYGNTFASYDNGQGIVLRNQNRACVAYILSTTGQLARAESSTVTDNCDNDSLYTGLFDNITDSNTMIDSLEMTVYPAYTTETVEGDLELTSQGLVTIQLTAHAKNKDSATTSIQSSVSSRQINPYEPATP